MTLGKVMILLVEVGSVILKVVVTRSAVVPSKTRLPVLARENTVEPEAEAVKIFWSPVSSKILRAVPVVLPVKWKRVEGVEVLIPSLEERILTSSMV